MSNDAPTFSTQVDYGFLGKYRLEDGRITDWTYFQSSHYFAQTLQRLFLQTFFREPVGDHGLKQSNRAFACSIRNEAFVFFCSVQRRWEGDLIGRAKSGRSYHEIRITVLQAAEFERSLRTCEQVYQVLFDRLTEPGPNSLQVHSMPVFQEPADRWIIEGGKKDPQLLVDGHSAIDHFVAAYAERIWKSRTEPHGRTKWKLVSVLYRMLMERKPVLIVLDTENSPNVDDLLLLMEILQQMIYFVDPKRRAITFSLDYFSQDLFEILFLNSSPGNTSLPDHYRNHFNLSAIENGVDYRLFNLQLGDAFRLVYQVFFLEETTTFDAAKQLWFRLLNEFRSTNGEPSNELAETNLEWGDLYISLLQGKVNQAELLTILNQAAEKRTIHINLLNEILDNPNQYLNEVVEKPQFWGNALRQQATLANRTLLYYWKSQANNPRDMERFVDSVRDLYKYHKRETIVHWLRGIMNGYPKT
jgi:hypothetical protein